MAGVFRLIKGPQRQLVGRHGVVQRVNPRALELQAAKEILAETFGVRISEVEEIPYSAVLIFKIYNFSENLSYG